MRYPASEKLEIIRLVARSHLPAIFPPHAGAIPTALQIRLAKWAYLSPLYVVDKRIIRPRLRYETKGGSSISHLNQHSMSAFTNSGRSDRQILSEIRVR